MQIFVIENMLPQQELAFINKDSLGLFSFEKQFLYS